MNYYDYLKKYNLAFYVSVDQCIKEMADSNTSLHDLSRIYPLYVLNSNSGKDNYIGYENAIFINEENSFSKKMIALLKHLKTNKHEYDLLIRLDADSVLFDILSLVRKTKCLFDTATYSGNYSQNVSRHILQAYTKEFDPPPFEQYVRGACSVLSKKSIEILISNVESITPSSIDLDFDYFMNFLCYTYGIELVDKPLFEISNKYSELRPVWHPLKEEYEDRLLLVKNQIKQYYIKDCGIGIVIE